MDNANKHAVFQNRNGQYMLFHVEKKTIKEKKKADILKALIKKRDKIDKTTDLAKDTVILKSCISEIDLSDAHRELAHLNAELKTKCSRLELKLKPFVDFLDEDVIRYSEDSHVCIGCSFYDTLILALCENQDHCISTIELVVSPVGEVFINSKTDPAHEGKKYNKLLRSVLFIIASKIPTFRYSKSAAINPISAWLLLKYSRAIVESGHAFEKFLEKKGYTLDTLTQTQVQEYFDTKGAHIPLIVQFDAALSAKSRQDFAKIVGDELRC
jgi:hypothetical protein